MYEILNDVWLNIVANGILFVFLLVYSIGTFSDYLREKSKRNHLFFSFEFCGTIYLLWSVIELLSKSANQSTMVLFTLSTIRVFFAILMYTFAGDYIVLLIETKQTVSKPVKQLLHWGLIILFFAMPIIYQLSRNTLLTNLPIFIYLLSLEAVVIRYREPLSTKTVILYTLFIIPSFLLLLQEYWNYTPANIYAAVLIVIIHCEVWQKQKIEMLEIEQQLAKQENELKDTRISLMSSQINPHFLFNTLSSIAGLCEKDGREAKYLTLEFASYMRNIAEDLDTLSTIPFSKEFLHTEHYINIEKVRFGEKLRFDFDIEEMDFRLPPLTLQPLVENAIKHGVMPQDGGLVILETTSDDNFFYIRIIDDGVGFDKDDVSDDSHHLGIQNITKRLSYMCDGELTIFSVKSKGTRAEIRIPKEINHENSIAR